MKIILICSLLFFTLSLHGKTYISGDVAFNIEKLYEGSDVIWGFDFLKLKDASSIVFSERRGKLKHLDLKTKKIIDIQGAPKVFAQSQGGLLDVYIDHETSQLYLTYSEPVKGGATTSLFRGKLSADMKILTGERLLQAKAVASGGIHFGSRVIVDKDGFIFISIGERNDRDRAQELSNHQGKILRINKLGKAPKDNPFVNIKGALPEIWSFGHRNPQGLFFGKDGELLEAEFGPRGGDEVNIIEKGKNYGWPVTTYGKEYWGPAIGVKKKRRDDPATLSLGSFN